MIDPSRFEDPHRSRLWGVRLWLFVAVVATFWYAADLLAALGSREAAKVAAIGLSNDLTEIARLRAAEPTAFYARPEEDALTIPLLEVLSRIGLSSGSLERQSGGTESPVPDTGAERFVRRSVQAAFAPMTLPQLGRFIQLWRELHPAWIISEIRMTHAESGSLFNVDLTFTTTYKDGPASGGISSTSEQNR